LGVSPPTPAPRPAIVAPVAPRFNPRQPKRKLSATSIAVGAVVVLLAIIGVAILIWQRAQESQPLATTVAVVEHGAKSTSSQTADHAEAPDPAAQPASMPTSVAASQPAAPVTTESEADATKIDLPPIPSPRDLLARAVATAPPLAAPAAAAPLGEPAARFPAASRGNLALTRPSTLELDDRIGQSMQLALDLILSQFQDDQLPQSVNANPVHRAGLDALCVYALLQAGQSLSDDRFSIHGKLVPKLLNALKRMDLSPAQPNIQDPVTYARSFRVLALSVCDRPEDRAMLKQDVAWLVRAQVDGAYSYNDWHAPVMAILPPDAWDNSNSQCALLAVWAGAELGIEVPLEYWQAVENHWRRSQQKDGQWMYSPYKPTTSLSMTCGGIASMLVTYDYLDVPHIGRAVGRDPFPGAIGAGLGWLEAEDHGVQTPTAETFYLGYDLYSLERVGLASGLKYFGVHDWYRELAAKALSYQFPNGAYGRAVVDSDTLVGTSYVLLFLTRGRAPLLMNKLRFDKFWANRPRDVANLARFASHELERQLNWQVVSADRPWQDWFDCPVLYIASHQPPKLTDAAYTNLRGFVNAGGLIFTQSDANSMQFNAWVEELARKICPDYELMNLPPTHPLFTSFAKAKVPLPRLRGVSNGSRLLIVHCPTDIAIAWQRRDDKMHPEAFNVGMNVVLYANGRDGFRNRVATTDLVAPAVRPSRAVKVARLQYAGNWNAEPFALERFGNYLSRTRGVGIEPVVVPLKELKLDTAGIALLCGTDAYHLTAEEIAAIQRYVHAGGLLIIDPIGGRSDFPAAIRSDFASRVFPGKSPEPLPADHPILKDLTLRLRMYARDLQERAPPLQIITEGQGAVLISPLDISTGLLNANTWGINGYTPESCEKLMTNIIDWAGFH